MKTGSLIFVVLAVGCTVSCKSKSGESPKRKSGVTAGLPKMSALPLKVPAQGTAVKDPQRWKRCVSLFRKLLGDLAARRLGELMKSVADGDLEGFKLVSAAEREKMGSWSAEKKSSFVGKNFPWLGKVKSRTDRIRYGSMIKGNKPVGVSVKGSPPSTKQQGTIYGVRIELPGFAGKKYRFMRCLEVDTRMYWIPFGW